MKKATNTSNFILELDGLGLYVSSKQNLTGIVLTKSKKSAMTFSSAFDNAGDKKEIWQSTAKKMMHNDGAQINIIYV